MAEFGSNLGTGAPHGPPWDPHIGRDRAAFNAPRGSALPRPADEAVDALAFALRFEGRQRTRDATAALARIVIERLERSGLS